MTFQYVHTSKLIPEVFFGESRFALQWKEISDATQDEYVRESAPGQYAIHPRGGIVYIFQSR